MKKAAEWPLNKGGDVVVTVDFLKNGDNDFSSFCKERLSETEAV